MDFKQFIRVFVCIVLVCILVFNCSPLRAQALEPISTALGIGVAALLLLGTAGIVFNPTSNDQIEAIGNSMQTYLYQWGTSAEKVDVVDDFFVGLQFYDGDPDDDGGDDTPHKRQFKIGNVIKTGIAAWLISIASGSTKVEEEGEVAPSGSAYFGDYLLPDFSSIPNYSSSSKAFILFAASNPTLYLFSADSQLRALDLSGTRYVYTYGRCPFSQYSVKNGAWSLVTNAMFPDQHLICSLASVSWSSFDIRYSSPTTGDIVFSGSGILTAKNSIVEPSTYVGDIHDGIKDGSITEENLELPDLIDYSQLAVNSGGLVNGVTTMLQNVHDGFLSYDELLATLQPAVSPEPEPEPDQDPSSPAEIPLPDLEEIPIVDVKGNVFFEKLGQVVTAPFKWIWEKLETKLDTLKPPEFDFDRLTSIITAPAEWIWPKLETFFAPLLDPDTLLAPMPDILEVPFRKTWEYIQAIPQEIAQAATELAVQIQAIPEKLTEVGTNIVEKLQALPNVIADAATSVKDAVDSLVVPDKDYLSDKLAALCEEFVFADSIVKTVLQMVLALSGLDSQPPVIYIDLGAFRGSYDIGGMVPFLDLRWYASYKPTVDALISAFLWICFIWRMFIKLPSIINGLGGDFVLIQSRQEER